ncbi:MAG: fibrinogen-like YCDxxxxGGGW domain-containing protein [Polyangiaceae bacterium]
MRNRTILFVGLPPVLALLVLACGSSTSTGEDAGSSSSSSSSGGTDASTSSSSSSSSGGNDAGTDTGIKDAAPDVPLGSFTVGGAVTGLLGTNVVITLNGAGDITIPKAGPFTFTFTNKVTTGQNYTVAVKTQPTDPTQDCVVTKGTGTMGIANVTDVAIACTTKTFKVGGTVAGLTGTVVLQNNGADDLTLTQNAAFSFATNVASGANYAATVKTHPANQVCTIANGSGMVTTAAITNIDVTCKTPQTCKEIKLANPAAVDGDYMVDPDGNGALPAITVFCDMTTDGGGYTYYPINGNGISTTRFDQANSCQAVGLNLAVPRTLAHLTAMFNKYTISHFKIVPGVYGLAAGNYTGCAMNSGDQTCSANWKAIDNGAWFAKPAAYSEPNGDYTPGCWLGLDGNGIDANGFVRFNDAGCGYATGTSYVCSDNAK